MSFSCRMGVKSKLKRERNIRKKRNFKGTTTDEVPVRLGYRLAGTPRPRKRQIRDERSFRGDRRS